MREIKGDLWTTPTDIICITTNGYVNKDGRAVMGRGCALEMKQKFPGIDKVLGRMIVLNGNHVHRLFVGISKDVYTFPVKHNWWDKADIELIKRSCHELLLYVGSKRTVLLPRPGCGNGHLTWEIVKPVIAPILPDNVVVISK